MRKALLAAAVLSTLGSSAAFAQASTAASTSPHTFSANVGLVSDYRFRGFTQTNLRPAIQGGFDYEHASGFYLGNWNSNVADELFPGGNIEMDFYGGYKHQFGDVGLDVGVLHYYYPGSEAAKGGTIKNTELYAGLSYGPFSLKYSHGVSDFFGVPDSKNNFYVDAGLAVPLNDGWGINAHVGYQRLKNDPAISGYVDYSLGVTKELAGWELGAKVVATNQKDWYQTSKGRDAGRTGVVFSVARAF
ncbi:hypothetical protein IMZ29_11795 [Achromobacter sp. GG226]|uniref:TorF family putative porin n=1 Tax=Verticiella alkaliphila TaxID=2779529 RepID=UPI001C0E19EA|nr:TorF family putative porin [Verticiella sp. GG226]MBU4611190.1 hypothetical protein [Verticiella sp. GG226]